MICIMYIFSSVHAWKDVYNIPTVLLIWSDCKQGRNLRETLNPNFVGYSAISLLIMVDFPHPLGPERTIGRSF